MPHIPTNAEPSIFMPGTYRIYDGGGRVWLARKSYDRTWRATPGANNPARALIAHIERPTLAALAAAVAEHMPHVAGASSADREFL